MPGGTELECDLCIIGAGAAGITIARELAGTRLRVCLLESGGLEPDQATQELTEGESVGLPYYALSATRLRRFGGTTNHWAGTCHPLDEIDFETRPWVRDSGWPLTRSELEPFYRRAHEICQLGPYHYDPAAWTTARDRALDLDARVLRTGVSLGSPPTRFGRVYRADIEHAGNVRTYLFANAVELEFAPGSERIARVRVACLTGNRLSVRARCYVLAAGGIENARLLLASDRRRRDGPGDRYDLVGRHFMDHPAVIGGVFLPIPRRPALGLYRSARAGGAPRLGFPQPTPDLQRREGLLNLRVFLEPASRRN